MTKLLSQEQVKNYQESGFVSPVDVLDQEEINQCLKEIESFENETGKTIDFYISHVVTSFFLGQII